MSNATLEDRVANLEAQVASLLGRSASADRPAWERALDRCTDSDVMRAIDKAALDYREEDRRRFMEAYDAASGSVE